ncbi:11300_t:CDS:2, partial [Dentiscutata erythropus]
FFSRGNDCVDHCWNICGRDIQVPCLGLKSCPVFQRIPRIASRFTIDDRYVRYICARCFEKHDPANLKQKIMAIQNEHERILLLYDEFVEDNKINIGNCKIKQYTKTL